VRVPPGNCGHLLDSEEPRWSTPPASLASRPMDVLTKYDLGCFKFVDRYRAKSAANITR